MSTIPQVAQALSTLLNSTANAAARRTNFVQRRSKLTGPRFVQSLVFGWLKNPQASLEELTQTTAALGVRMSPQGLDQRFGPKAAATLEQVLNAAVTQVIAAHPVAIPLLQRFGTVVVLDPHPRRFPLELFIQRAGEVKRRIPAYQTFVRLET